MANVTEHDFDLEGYMDDLDRVTFDYQTPGDLVKDDRDPITKIRTAALDTVISTDSMDQLRSALREYALPEGYLSAIDAGDEALLLGKDIYDSAIKSFKPAADTLRTMIHQQEGKIRETLPEWAAEQVLKLGKEAESGSWVDPHEAAIQMAMNEVFQRREEVSLQRNNYDMMRDDVNMRLDDVRHRQSINVLDTISQDISRMTNYQDRILENYQRKDLELQMRQYFILKDLLSVTEVHSDTTRQQLSGILKNTGLPDFAKLRVSENYGQMIENKILGNLQESMNQYISKFTERFRENIGGRAKEFFSNLGGTASMAMDAISSAVSGGSGDTVSTGSRFATSTLISALLPQIANTLGRRIEGSDRVQESSAYLQYLSENFPMILEEMSRGESGGLPMDLSSVPGLEAIADQLRFAVPKDVYMAGQHEPVITGRELATGQYTDIRGNPIKDQVDIQRAVEGIFKEGEQEPVVKAEDIANVELRRADRDLGESPLNSLLRDYVPSFNRDREVLHNLSETATDVAGFDQITRRSIIEVIPGYLSRILQQATIIATGDQSAERVVYSAQAENFLTESESKADLEKRIFNDDSIGKRREYVSSMADEMIGGSTISDEAREALIDQLITDFDSRRRFDTERFKDQSRFGDFVDEDVANELSTFFQSSDFNINNRQLLKLSRQYNRMGELTRDPDEAIRRYNALGDKEALRRLGLVQNVDGQDTVNVDFMMERLRGGTGSSRPRGGMGGLSGGGPTPGQLDLFAEEGGPTPPPQPADVSPTDASPPPPPVIESPPTPSRQMDTVAEVIGDRVADALGGVSASIQDLVYPESYGQWMEQMGESLRQQLNGGVERPYESFQDLVRQVGGNVESHLGSLSERLQDSMQGASTETTTEPEATEETITLTDVVEELRAQAAPDLSQFDNQAGDEGFEPSAMSLAELIDAINENFATNHVLLQNIADNVVNGSGTMPASGGGGLMGRLRSGGGALRDMLVSYYRGFGAVGGAVAGATGTIIGRGVGGLARGLTRKRETDIYIKGQEKPVIRARDLKNGRYFIQGETEPVRSLEDILEAEAPIVDANGEEVLSLDEIAQGLEDRRGSVLGKLGRTLGGAVGGLWKTEMRYLGMLAKVPKAGLDVLKRYGNRERDVYVKGESKPRMRVMIMKNGGYFSTTTQKPVLSIKDIDGEILNGNGNTVISEEDLRTGLVDRWGVPIETTGAMGVLGTYARRGAAMLGRVGGLGAKAILKSNKWILDRYVDAGRFAGRQAGKLLRRGKKGKVEQSGGGESIGEGTHIELDTTNTLLQEQLACQKAIVDWLHGRTSEEEAEAETATFTEAQFKRDEPRGDAIDTDDDNVRDVSVQGYLSEQLDVMRDLAGRDKEDFEDTDDDNLRDNSWMAQAKAAREAVSEGKDLKEEKPEKGKDKQESGFGFLGKMIGVLTGAVTSGLGMLKDVILTAIGANAGGSIMDSLFGGNDTPDRDGRPGSNRPPRGGRPGIMSRIAGMGRGALSFLTGGLLGSSGAPSPGGGSTLARGAAAARTGLMAASSATGLTTAAAGIGTALGATGATALAIGGGVIAAGVAAVGGVGYGGYKLYKHIVYSSDVEPLEGLRFLQYGVPLEDEEAIYLIRELENDVISEMDVSEKGISFDEEPDYFFKEWGEDFGMDLESADDAQRWTYWFSKRFGPVLANHAMVLYALDSGADLDDIDDELDDELKAKFIRNVTYTQKDKDRGINPLGVTISPWKNKGIIQNPKLIEAYGKQLLDSLATHEDLDDFDPVKTVKLPLPKEKQTPTIQETVSDTQKLLVSGMTAGTLAKGHGLTASGKVGGYSTAAIFTAPDIAKMHTGPVDGLGSFFSKVGKSIMMPVRAIKGHLTVEPLEGLRFLQYGCSLEDRELLFAVRDLEEAVLEDITWSGNTPTLSRPEWQYFEDHHKDFKRMHDEGGPDWTEWMTWFSKRFLPILVTHLTALKQADDGVDLTDIDEAGLSASLQADFITTVHFTEKDRRTGLWPYGVSAAPMRQHGIITDERIIGLYVRGLLDTLKTTDSLEAFNPKRLESVIQTSPEILADIQNLEKGQYDSEPKGTPEAPSPNRTGIRDTDGNIRTAYMKPGPTGDSKLIMPLAEGEISSEFGDRIHPVTGARKHHKGVDFAAPMGTPVYAAADGSIYRQYRSNSYGNVVYLKHKDGTASRYGHLSRFSDSKDVGSEVVQGELIGYVGNTGISSGPHLHFEYRKTTEQNAQALDPTAYFEAETKRKIEREVEAVQAAATEEGDPTEGLNTLVSAKRQASAVEEASSPRARLRGSKGGGGSLADMLGPEYTFTEVSELQHGTTSVGRGLDEHNNPIQAKLDEGALDGLTSVQQQTAGRAEQQREKQIAMQQELNESISALTKVLADQKGGMTEPTKTTTGETSKSTPKSERPAERVWPQTRTTTGVFDNSH